MARLGEIRITVAPRERRPRWKVVAEFLLGLVTFLAGSSLALDQLDHWSWQELTLVQVWQIVVFLFGLLVVLRGITVIESRWREL